MVAEEGLPEPRKSSCVFCPYHSDAFWLDLRANYPAEWARAVTIDEAIRDMSASGAKSPVYLHRSLKPLRQAEFRHERQTKLALEGEGFENECDGVCAL